MAKKIIVTGASGFLGSHICQALYDAEYDVHAILRATSSRRWLEHGWLRVHRAELDDPRALSAVLRDAYAVVHSAAALIGASENELHRTNVLATIALAEESIKAGVKKFVFISSNSAGGPNDKLVPKTESDPDRPLGPYGRSKKEAEERLAKLSGKIRIVNLRPVLIYGPRDRHLVRLFRLFRLPVVPILGTKPVYLPMVYVQDVADAVVKSLKAEVPSPSTFYVSDGMPYTMDTVYDAIAFSLGKKLRFMRIPLWLAAFFIWIVFGTKKKEVAFTPQTVREFKDRYRLISIEKARKELGWEPQSTIHGGIPATVEWYRRHGWL